MTTPNPLPTEVSRDTIAQVRKDVFKSPTARESADDDATIRVKDTLSPSLEKDHKLEGQPLDNHDGDVIEHYPDGGWRAWSVVFGDWILCACFLGFGLIWGVVTQYYIDFVYQDTSPTLLNFASGIYSFVSTGTSFVAGRAGERYGYKRALGAGGVLFVICLFISAFTYTSLVAMFLVQSIGLGVATGITLPLIMSIPSQWFKRRRALATGITTSASGVGGGISTFILRVLFRDVGPRNAFLIFAGLQAVLIIAGLWLVRVRDVTENRMPKHWLPDKVWSNRAWYSMMFAIFIGPFGFLTPFYLITRYTQEHVPGLDGRSYLAAVPTLTMQVVSGFGRIGAGMMADRIGPLNTMIIGFALGGLFQMTVWPFVTTFSSIMGFCVLEGAVLSWFVSLMAPVCSTLFGSSGIATTVGFMMLVNSPGQLLGNTISTALLQSTDRKWCAATTFSGGMMLLAACALLPARVMHQKRLMGKI